MNNQTTNAKWQCVAQELENDIYGGRLNLQETPTETFIAWYLWRMENNPNTATGIPLKDFDAQSAMMFFEDDVKEAIAKATK